MKFVANCICGLDADSGSRPGDDRSFSGKVDTLDHLRRHPPAGELELHYEKLLIPAAAVQTLVTYHAEPGSDSEERLRLLAALSAADPAPPASGMRLRAP